MTVHVYLDMDGVIADFMGRYKTLFNNTEFSRETFRYAIEQKHIFENLDKEVNADKLLDLLFKQLDVNVCILSSKGTRDVDLGKRVFEQKLHWLKTHNIVCPAIFVNGWYDKKLYAKRGIVLIDDREDVIEQFETNGGIGVTYKASDWINMEMKIRSAVARAKQITEEVVY